MRRTAFARPAATAGTPIPLIAAFGLLLIASVWIFAWAQIEFDYQAEIDNSRREYANITRAFEEHVRRTLQTIDDILLFIRSRADTPAGFLAARPSVNRYYDNEYLNLLSLIDADGNLVVSSQPTSGPVNVADRDFFLYHRSHADDELFIGRPVLGRVTGKWLIPVSRRLYKPDGSFGGVVLASVNPQYFSGFYRQMDLGAQQAVTLIGREDGIVRAREARDSTEIGQDVRGDVLFQHIKKAPAGFYTGVSIIDGVRRLYSYRVMHDYPLVVKSGIAETEALARFAARKNNYLAAA